MHLPEPERFTDAPKRQFSKMEPESASNFLLQHENKPDSIIKLTKYLTQLIKTILAGIQILIATMSSNTLYLNG
jgi:hypothetical protein